MKRRDVVRRLYNSGVVVLAVLTVVLAVTLGYLTSPVTGVVGLILLNSHIIATSLEPRAWNCYVKVFYISAFTISGYVLIAAPLFAAAYILILLAYITGTSFPAHAVLGACFLLPIVASIYAYQNAATLRIRKENFTHDVDTRIVHISDIHVGAVRGAQWIRRIVDTVNSLQPDIVCITGDFFDGTGRPGPADVQPLEDIKAPMYFCMGNHEGYFGVSKSQELLESVGVTVLRNEVADSPAGRIVGIDDVSIHKRDPEEDFKALQSKDPSILLYHRPSFIETFVDTNYWLMLSGHTHNGQLHVVRVGLRLLGSFTHGFFEFPGKALNVSSGTGTGGPPLRLGSQTEICLLTTTPKE